MRESIFQQRCNTNISVVWHLCRGHRLRRPILHRKGNARYALSGLRGSGGGGMDSNHRLVLFTHALCRLSYPAACGPLGEGFRGTWGLPLSQGSAPRTLSASERSITSGFRMRLIVGTFRETRTEINYRKWANVFPAAKSEPRQGMSGLSD